MWVHRQAVRQTGRQASGGPELLHPLVVLVEIRLAHRLRHLRTGRRIYFGWKVSLRLVLLGCVPCLYVFVSEKS